MPWYRNFQSKNDIERCSQLYPRPRYSTVGAVGGGELMRKLTVKKNQCILVITITDMNQESERV